MDFMILGRGRSCDIVEKKNVIVELQSTNVIMELLVYPREARAQQNVYEKEYQFIVEMIDTRIGLSVSFGRK